MRIGWPKTLPKPRERTWLGTGKDRASCLADHHAGKACQRLGSSGVEHWIENPGVGGSRPPPATNSRTAPAGAAQGLSSQTQKGEPPRCRLAGCRHFGSNPPPERPLQGRPFLPSGSCRAPGFVLAAARRRTRCALSRPPLTAANWVIPFRQNDRTLSSVVRAADF